MVERGSDGLGRNTEKRPLEDGNSGLLCVEIGGARVVERRAEGAIPVGLSVIVVVEFQGEGEDDQERGKQEG